MEWVEGRQKMLGEEEETGDPRSLEPVMLLAWSVSTDPPLLATARAERHEEGESSLHHDTHVVWGSCSSTRSGGLRSESEPVHGYALL